VLQVDSAQLSSSNAANNGNHKYNATFNASPSKRNATIIPKHGANHSSRDDTPNFDNTSSSSTRWTITTLFSIANTTSADNMPLKNRRKKLPISIVVQLSGEMGNNLHKIAFGRGLQNLLKKRYQMDTQLVFRRQERGGKWVFARKDIQQCFPNLRDFDFELGNSDEFDERRRQQANWLKDREAFQLLELPNGINASLVDKGLEYLHSLVANQTTDRTTMELPPNANISLPFIYSQAFVNYSLIDQFYNDFRELFAFDELACCNLLPDADESVFVSFKMKEMILLWRHACFCIHMGSHVYHIICIFVISTFATIWPNYHENGKARGLKSSVPTKPPTNCFNICSREKRSPLSQDIRHRILWRIWRR
jgi:hypothetical protein